MGKKLYVGNLAFSVTEQTLSDKFSECGSVFSSKIIMDHESNRSKGFGFIEMTTEFEAQEALKTLNNTELEGRTMVVNEARPKAAPERDSRTRW